MAEPPYGLSDDKRAEVERYVREVVAAAPAQLSPETITNMALDFALARDFVVVVETNGGQDLVRAFEAGEPVEVDRRRGGGGDGG